MQSWVEKGPLKEIQENVIPLFQTLSRSVPAVANQSPTIAGGEKAVWVDRATGEGVGDIDISLVPNMCQTPCWLL